MRKNTSGEKRKKEKKNSLYESDINNSYRFMCDGGGKEGWLPRKGGGGEGETERRVCVCVCVCVCV